MRSRNIKPGFFTNEKLAELGPFTRILFIGLWCVSDREGRFEWRPKRIKAEVLPYDNGEITVMLRSLCDAGFIVYYKVDGVEYGQVVNFCKHQNPHHTEKASKLPKMQADSSLTVNSPLKNGENPADSLIPDSLIPDSLIPDSSTPLPPTGGKKPKQKKIFTPPSESEVIDYFLSNGQPAEDGKRAYQYYDAGNWIDSQGSPVRNWKQKMIANWFKKREPGRDPPPRLTARTTQNMLVVEDFKRRHREMEGKANGM